MAGENSFSSSLKNSPSMEKFVLVVFAHSLLIKLDDNNFLLWKQQVGVAIQGHKLQKFILESENPPKMFLTARDHVQGKINPEYLNWEQQDRLLFSWLLSSMTEVMLTRMVGCETSHHIWKTLEVFFASQIKAKISQFKTRLHNTKKDDLSINDYLLNIESLIDQLAFVGYVVTTKCNL